MTATGLITCIGLVMDYANHICLTYFEIHGAISRNERVKMVISSIGISILKGGFTTFLGILCLGFNSTLSFRTMFITFIAITTMGVSHGLIFLPIVLSIWGPMKDSKDIDEKTTLTEESSFDGDEVLFDIVTNINKKDVVSEQILGDILSSESTSIVMAALVGI